MRTSFALFTALVFSAVTAFATPVENDFAEKLVKRGKSTATTGASRIHLPQSNDVTHPRNCGPEICTSNRDGSGETDEQVTKDCCAAVKQQAYFNEAEKQCQPYGGHLGNSVDTGEMVKCCASRGCGSRAV
ncbi:hypothetical protein D9615_003244 [Tricholomella constricta]|uniref:Uncharacterized protein n=1 Tax=Tricholomella constricta TaxID=117010 RepID=A0A8H5M819_9AGAR|nr:hypothetical protein D9615_003244 [Tricholomella constricta]